MRSNGTTHGDIIYLVAENYQLNHPRLNRHTLNVFKSVIETKELSFQEIAGYRLIERTHLILKSMLANK